MKSLCALANLWHNMTPSFPACNPELTNDMREKPKYLNEPLRCFCMTSVPPLPPCFSECVTWIHPSLSSTWPNGGLLLGTWLSSWSCTNWNIEALSVGRNFLMCWNTHLQNHQSASIGLYIFGGLYSTPTSGTVQDRVPRYPFTMVFLFSTWTEMPKSIIDNLGCGDNLSTIHMANKNIQRLQVEVSNPMLVQKWNAFQELAPDQISHSRETT